MGLQRIMSRDSDELLCRDFVLDGWVRKNHNGHRWLSDGRLRYCKVFGFQVLHFKEASDTKPCSGFDLRNVRCLRPSVDPNAPAGALDLLVAERRSSTTDKLIIIALPDGKGERDRWLRHFCSAVSEEALSSHVRIYRDKLLAVTLDGRHGGQGSMSQPAPVLASDSPRMAQPVGDDTPSTRRTSNASFSSISTGRPSPTQTPQRLSDEQKRGPSTSSESESSRRGSGLLEAVFEYAEKRKVADRLMPFPSASVDSTPASRTASMPNILATSASARYIATHAARKASPVYL